MTYARAGDAVAQARLRAKGPRTGRRAVRVAREEVFVPTPVAKRARVEFKEVQS